MIDTMGLLMDSWQELIDGVISVPCHNVDVPEGTTGDYVHYYPEGEAEDDTKQSFRREAVVVVQIVTEHEIMVDGSRVAAIDREIKQLIKTSPGVHGLMAQAGMQILNVVASDAVYLIEEDGTKKYYRKIVRYTHKIVEN